MASGGTLKVALLPFLLALALDPAVPVLGAFRFGPPIAWHEARMVGRKEMVRQLEKQLVNE